MSAFDPKRTSNAEKQITRDPTVPSEASVYESVPMICVLRTQCKKFDLAQRSKKQPRDIPGYETHTSQCSEWEHFETAESCIGRSHRAKTR
jgi:hypothetical protein